MGRHRIQSYFTVNYDLVHKESDYSHVHAGTGLNWVVKFAGIL